MNLVHMKSWLCISRAGDPAGLLVLLLTISAISAISASSQSAPQQLVSSPPSHATAPWATAAAHLAPGAHHLVHQQELRGQHGGQVQRLALDAVVVPDAALLRQQRLARLAVQTHRRT